MNDDPTKKLPDDETRYDTQPTITTVLERLNEMDNGLRAEIQALRSEMNQQFVLLNKKFRMLIEEVMQVRAEHEVFEDRLDKLEQKTP